jgi:serine/threonine protein kinase/Tol biopolymer transport system component
MGLVSGTKLGPYEILSPLGAGGMGEVYRARDSRLERDVAMKVLPAAMAHDAERMARFHREAQVLASLNHPNIAAVHGLEESTSVRALVMEFVDGATLAEFVGARRAVPIQDALPIAKQIGDALEYAHERGIVHRDLKPANIKITPEGTVKVLDFGLAKALDVEMSTSSNVSNSPTLTAAATQAGVILGTAAYMSPEQARGKAADRRADVWAFGCVLFEMLTGQRTFGGDTVSDTLAGVLKSDPDWAALPATVPPSIQRLLRRCLMKDPKQRLQAIGEARIAIEETMSGDGAAIYESPLRSAAGTPPLQSWRRALPWALAGFFALALLSSMFFLRRVERLASLPVTKFALMLPAGELPFGFGEGPGVAISPDSTKLVFVSTSIPAQLQLRRLDTFQTTPMPGTEGAESPFFSPDGQWVGFFANGKLKKVSTEGGMPATLADAPVARGASWSPDGTIVFSPSVTSGLVRVPDGGGKVETLTTPDASSGQRTHRWPEVLPDGKTVLFLIGKLTSPTYFDDSQVAALSVETGKYQVVLEHTAMARYAATDSGGYIVYAHAGDLYAVPFDAQRLQVTGRATSVVEGVTEVVSNGAAHFALSRNGSLIFSPGGPVNRESNLIWMDRKGDEHAIAAPVRPYAIASLSPDGQRAATETYSTSAGSLRDIGIYDFARNTLTRLTFTGDNEVPIWTPDGKRVAYYSARSQNPGIYWGPADGSQPPELLTPMTSNGAPTSFSPDGKFLAYVQLGAQTATDIWVLPLEGDRKPHPFAQEPFNEGWASFSPDGRWLAYMSDETGQDEIYVRPFPGPGGKWQVSNGGGNYPIWAKSGRELFYINGDKLMSVPIETRLTFSAGTPQLVFEKAPLLASLAFGLGPFYSLPFDVAPDGQRFLLIKHSLLAPTQINVVLNWFEELKRTAAGEKR